MGLTLSQSTDGQSAGELARQATKAVEERYFVPDSLCDERERTLREIVQRRGQPKFREELIRSYGGQCAVTGCDALAALEAAHIVPYCGSKSNHVTNGLLLRADIHTLFDLDLIGVEPNSFIIDLAPALSQTTYWELKGKALSLTESKIRPSKEALADRWNRFREHNGEAH